MGATRIFHLGLPKAGSTTLQRCIQSTGELNYLGKNPYTCDELAYLVRTLLPFSDLRSLPLPVLDHYAKMIPPGSFVSDEILSGVGFMHGMAANSVHQILDNIDLLTGGDYRALLILRRPEDFLASYYAQLVKMEARLSFDQFCSLVLLRQHSWVFAALNYGALLRSVAFRSGKLRIFLFEDLFSSPSGLGTFLNACGLTTPVDPATLPGSQTSPADAVVDLMAQTNPYNPGLVIDLTVLHPSLQEFLTLSAAPPETQHLHQPLWGDQFAVLSALRAQAAEARPEAEARSRLRRPRSAIATHLLQEIFATNANLDKVGLSFDHFGYFRLDPARAPEYRAAQ